MAVVVHLDVVSVHHPHSTIVPLDAYTVNSSLIWCFVCIQYPFFFLFCPFGLAYTYVFILSQLVDVGIPYGK